MLLQLQWRVPDDAVVLVSYVQPAVLTDRLRDNSDNSVASFTWDVNADRQIPLPPEQAVYLALGRYFSGAGSLSSTERFVDSYFEDLLAKVAEGGLSDDFKIGDDDEQRSAWGTEGTEDWGQVGSGAFPREFCYLPPGATEPRCVDTQAEWGWGTQYQCGGRPQPGLHNNDYLNFFWACTGDGQWVPVKRPRPGLDYSHDSDLIRPPEEPGTNDNYDEKCRYVRRHPDGHPQAGEPVLDENGNRIPEPVHRYNGDGTWTTIRGANYDPIDGSCRGRG